MSRLIDADAFDERIRLDVSSCEEELTEDFKDGILTVLEMMKKAPAVDAVEVVRCGECRYWDRFPSCSATPQYHACKRRIFATNVHTMRDDFCSLGERKDGDGK